MSDSSTASQPHTHLSLSGELARAFHAAAQVAIAGRTATPAVAKVVLVELVDAGGADRIGAIEQALAEFAFQQQALLGGDHRREAWRRSRAPAPSNRELRARRRKFELDVDRRHQHAGLALDGRIGRREVGQPGDRLAEEFEARVLEIDHLLALVVDDARGLHLPQRRLLRIVLAGHAGGVDAVMEDGEVAARCARRGRPPCGSDRGYRAAASRRTRRDNRPTGP